MLQKTPKNFKLTHHDIQKNIVNAIALETSKAIIKNLDNGFFSILVDESRNVSVKEQMALVFCYMNKKWIIIERFLGIEHIASTTALSLKYAIERLLCEHNLSLSRLRGQGFDGAIFTQVLVYLENNGIVWTIWWRTVSVVEEDGLCAIFFHCL